MNKEKYILAIDSGTTSSKAIAFCKDGTIAYSCFREIKSYFPHPSWVEQDPTEILVSVLDCINELMIRLDIEPTNFEAIGISNQRETTILFDRATGKPVYNAIVWQSKQTQTIMKRYKKYEEIIRNKTGLRISPYFSASKIRYILDKLDLQERAEKGEIAFATVDTWLIYKLTNGGVFATDYSNASRTMLYNIFDLKWDEELLAIFNIPSCMLPEVKNSIDDYGKATLLKNSFIPIRGVAGDQQSALFGQTCFSHGDCKTTYGTGLFMLMNVGEEKLISENGLLTTIAWGIDGKITYALEGTVFIGGAAIQWLRDELRIIDNSDESEYMAKAAEEQNVYVVPAFVGLGTPYWDEEARGSILGITRGTTRENIVRATLESIAYQTYDLLKVMKMETKCGDITSLRVDGGATKNKFLLQFQSDILNCEIVKPKILETTALGAAYLAGIGTGFFHSLEAIKKFHENSEIFTPLMEEKIRQKKCRGWSKAIEATRIFKID